ncbi:hypothetical protein KIN20_027426 [Parelaphostrongylus tenuis]|uniref:Uncharacterized protein n=1 Tax=Parelaphostrongylus tenuis TaxID=148309 RepID=A0AAD5QZ99_PARTN|nr:hypothetical protein KIN20_027426 [Parelaphostrongylus tenuis]
MAVSDIYANLLLVEEKELISNPERWFYKLTQNKNRSIEEEMARIYLHGAEDLDNVFLPGPICRSGST